jgi:tetratricopeptide (TPR) repeat protein
MQRGERCHLWVTPEYGYGATGSFSFPTVPPNASLTYDVELLDFEPPTEGKEQRDMTYEERLEAAERRRTEGNAAYKGAQYQEAIRKYNAALAFVDEDLLIQLQGFHYDRAMETRLPALLNASACHLKLGEYHAVVSAASQVLSHDARNAKALFRRGAARHALGQTEHAMADLKAAREVAPGDAGIARELAALKQTMLKEREAQGKLFKGVVDKFGASGGLYEDEGLEPPTVGGGGPFEATNLLDGGEIGRIKEDQSWLMWLMESMCPFVFGRRKKET